ncbi:AraC family transcriptional regulator [Bacillus sp. HMF5848]|uniref:helix-turn-helix domain-containing protein n=1 Tax=Bacillus sp. HMF5848 TaxID=2495421 RepID=UPI000F793338|nr:AraC family transcriptional regulator [Bacillus sp. HMF5848]RSK26184.1 AraC family transcriptional regulator [Bacillus sp. HMF5848]
MTIHIGYCGYSFHTQRFYSQNKSGFPAYLFRIQTEGVCKITAQGKNYQVEKGDLLLIKPGDDYELLIEETNDESIHSADYHLACEGTWIDEWWQRSPKPTVSRIGLDEKLLALWRHLTVEMRRPTSADENELTGYLIRALCVSLERAVTETALNRPYAVTRMMRYIEEHATTELKIEDVAQYVGLSVSRAVHLFKNSVDMTMIEYAQDIRITAAIERMKYTSMTLEQIAQECGFGTYPYFHRVFKKKYGISPGSYRQNE